jgi:hypothetical protein
VKLIFAAGLFAATSAVAMAQSQPGTANQSATTPQPQQQQQQQPQQQQQQDRNSSTRSEQTLTGCLTAADNIYTLTVMDDSGAPGTTATTTAYTLLPGTGVDLKNFVDKRVTVKGADAGPDMQDSARIVQRTPPAPAPTGTSGTNAAGGNSGADAGSANAGGNARSNAGGAQPTVQTEAKARINAKTLNVSDVQPASGSCGAH